MQTRSRTRISWTALSGILTANHMLSSNIGGKSTPHYKFVFLHRAFAFCFLCTNIILAESRSRKSSNTCGWIASIFSPLSNKYTELRLTWLECILWRSSLLCGHCYLRCFTNRSRKSRAPTKRPTSCSGPWYLFSQYDDWHFVVPADA